MSLLYNKYTTPKGITFTIILFFIFNRTHRVFESVLGLPTPDIQLYSAVTLVLSIGIYVAMVNYIGPFGPVYTPEEPEVNE